MKYFLLLGTIIPFAIVIGDPGSKYLANMCFPKHVDSVPGRQAEDSLLAYFHGLENSTFPCEQAIYQQLVCFANGTEIIDFIAEQQCLCNGGYFSALEGCDACFRAHGAVYLYSPEEEASGRSSLSLAECTPNPPTQGFTNFLATRNTDYARTHRVTISNDQFPNATAVSNYFTPTRALGPGKVTGSATARLTSYINTGNVRFTPSPISSSGSGSPSASTNGTSSGILAKEVPVVGGLVLMLFGILTIT
jgi:hypothetical protein